MVSGVAAGAAEVTVKFCVTQLFSGVQIVIVKSSLYSVVYSPAVAAPF